MEKVAKTSEQTNEKTGEQNDYQIVEGEILEVSTGKEIEDYGKANTKISTKTRNQIENKKSQTAKQTVYLVIPFIFLTVTLLGGLRLSAENNDFLFLKPALICLVFAAIMLVLFFRANLVRVRDWFSEELSFTGNAANAVVLFTLFTASAQVFNALLPERGLPFWVVAFCFFWTLWNNLFAEFDTVKLLKSLGALFGLAFVAKYLILANLTALASENWLKGLWENPARETFTLLLDLPRFSAGTGYIQFFTLTLYLIGLFLIPQNIQTNLQASPEHKI